MSSVAASNGDAHDVLRRLTDDLRRAAIDVAWRQWASVGAAATGRTAGERSTTRLGRAGALALHTMIDPEALLLVSLLFMEEERRFGDLVHDWAMSNSTLLSVQRTKNLERTYPAEARGALLRHLVWFSAAAEKAGDARWGPAARNWEGASHRVSKSSATTPSHVLRPKAHGGKSSAAATHEVHNATARARLLSPAALMFRLRRGIGVSSKADVLSYLLACADEWMSVREIAGATSYTVAAIRRATDDLAAARLIDSRPGNTTSHTLRFSAWAPLLALDARAPRWGSWHERFAFTIALCEYTDSALQRPLSDYALGVAGRRLMEQHRAAFERDAIAEWSAHSAIGSWAEFFERSVRTLAAWMRDSA